jgi:predicted DNA-binding transcriptional regulator AlpA
MPPDLLTTDELADWLRTTPAGIHSLRYRSEGPPAVRVGRRLLFARADVEAWLESRKENGAPANGSARTSDRWEGVRGGRQ